MWQLKQKMMMKINNHKNSFDIVSAMNSPTHFTGKCPQNDLCIQYPYIYAMLLDDTKINVILLMEEILHQYGESTIIYKVLKTSQVVITGFLPSTVLFFGQNTYLAVVYHPNLRVSLATFQVVRVKIEEWMSWGYPNGIIKLPTWSDQTMQIYGQFKGFLLNSALFSVESNFSEKYLYILVLKVLFRKVVWF